MCVILLYTNALQMHKQEVMCFVCTLSVSRRKTPQKNNHQNRNAHQGHSDEEKGDDVFHHQMVFEQKKKFHKKK